MSRRIRQSVPSFPSLSRLVSLTCRAALPGLLALALPGCASPGDAHNADGSRMTHDQMLVHGDDMKIEGLKLKTEGARTGDDAMAQRGETLTKQGQELQDKADAMSKKAER